MLGRFRAAHYELSAEELLIVELAHCPLRFFDGLHLHEGEPLRALIMFVAHDLGVLDMADAVEEVKQIALRRVEG